MNLNFFQSASDASSSAQQPIIKKEPMDVSTTDVVKDGAVIVTPQIMLIWVSSAILLQTSLLMW